MPEELFDRYLRLQSEAGSVYDAIYPYYTELEEKRNEQNRQTEIERLKARLSLLEGTHQIFNEGAGNG